MQIPKLCATDMPGRVRLLPPVPGGDRGPRRHARLLHHAGRAGHDGHDPDRPAASVRRGVMELYISDHPLDCLTCAANGDCELQDMAGAVGLRDVRYGYEGDNHLRQRRAAKDWLPSRIPVFHLRSVEMHRLLALRARLRGSAGHLRADHRRPRLRQPRVAGHGRAFPRLGMRLLRRLRAGLPDRDADRENRRSRSASPNIPSSPPAPIAASAAPSRPRCAATSSCAWCPTRTARPITAIPASRAASPGATPRTRTAS